MSQLQFILCGGFGINVGKDLLKMPGTKIVKEASYLALDTSDSNDTEGMFPLVHMSSLTNSKEGLEGSGKNPAVHYARVEKFVAEVFKEHKPSKHVVVIAAGGGGTGPAMGLGVVRHLLSMNVNVVLVNVNESGSLIEKRNSTKLLQGYAKQTRPELLNKVIPLIRLTNTPDKTWSDINKDAVFEINLLSLFLIDNNDGLDNEDIKNLFQYSESTGLPPALSEIHFYIDEGIPASLPKPPVSYCSLHDSRENVRSIFQNAAYRATGVINPDNNPPSGKTIVLALDHGDALDRLKQEIVDLEETISKSKQVYAKQEDVSPDANDDGSCW